ncbi:MAG: DUF1080 domain-containing protein [Kiritimatiellae bacterium]|nr:DUF1080 domain-containing protein [Kiritimatiellia bacterium]
MLKLKTTFLFPLLLLVGFTSAADNFNGAWSLTSPAGLAVWLKVEESPEKTRGWMMWEIGGVDEIKEIRREQDKLVIVRPYYHWYMTVNGMKRDQLGVDTLSATVAGDSMTMVVDRVLPTGQKAFYKTIHGKRAPALPPAPDLSALVFDKPVELFNGTDLSGWSLTKADDNNAWSARDGILSNNPQLEEGAGARQFGNIRTVREFDDFRLQLEVRLPRGGNSGIYLRGRYEVQVTDSHGNKSLTGIGSVYSRIPALVNAARPAGEWQDFDIILADRHVTVRLNGLLVIDNQPLEGCTGGALDADDNRSGPIYFQGDHTAVEYRNIRLFPRIK